VVGVHGAGRESAVENESRRERPVPRRSSRITRQKSASLRRHAA
jgi:hypothetical protein